VGQVTLVVTDDQGIQALNHDFLGRDVPTDVLAFDAQADAGGFVAAPEISCYLGDVIVSYPRAVVQAEEAGHSTEQELALLVIHGILHLLGYDHADEDERAIMWGRQDAILQAMARSARS
jgi:probable rRNA maturation factor